MGLYFYSGHAMSFGYTLGAMLFFNFRGFFNGVYLTFSLFWSTSAEGNAGDGGTDDGASFLL